ncbi:MAG TPA: hypothetical protein VMW04_03600 [Patescibacteria group bacterium]|nr:hypothetical protein [Patescibacteria group bacterium]
MAAQSENGREKLFTFLLMFVIGFVGFSILGTITLVLLIALGLLPSI